MLNLPIRHTHIILSNISPVTWIDLGIIPVLPIQAGRAMATAARTWMNVKQTMGDVLPPQWCPVLTPWALSTVDSVLQVSSSPYILIIQYVFKLIVFCTYFFPFFQSHLQNAHLNNTTVSSRYDRWGKLLKRQLWLVLLGFLHYLP